MSEQTYQIQLDNFEGPLDLLLHLIDKNKIDIYDIPIASITDQYLSYLEEAQQLDLDVASEFLLMAATLINIKAKMLLPKKTILEEEEPLDPREELVARLLEYKFYKEAAKQLKENEEQAGGYVVKEIDIACLMKDFKPANPVANITLQQLLDAFEKVIIHVVEEPPTMTLEREEFDVEQLMEEIVVKLHQCEGLAFTDLFHPKESKRKIVSVFLAILELCKLDRLQFQQRDNFGHLWVFARV